MSRRLLTRDDETLLRDTLKLKRPDLLPLIDEAMAGRILSVDEANEIRDAVGDELEVDDAGALTARGRRLDDLIDAVARVSELHLR